MTPVANPEQLEAATVELLAETLRTNPPLARRFQADVALHDRPIGAYLLALGYATPGQIARALDAQGQPPAQGAPGLIGELLVAQEAVTPSVMAALLVTQLVDRLLHGHPALSGQLGEHLIGRGLVTPAQLAQAFALQLSLRQQARWERLGVLLVEAGALAAPTLAEVLAVQQRARLPDPAAPPTAAD